MKNWIKSLKLRWSDLCLLVGFIPFALFLVFGQLFMQYADPNEVAFPLWAIIICFVISALAWGAYIYLEYKKEKNIPNKWITAIFIFLAILNIITIAVQPSYFVEGVTVRVQHPSGPLINSVIDVPITISNTHKIFFALDITLILAFIYIGLFMFPKRFTGIGFIKYLGYGVYAFCIILILYGYIAEHGSYVPYLKCLFGQIDEDPANYAIKSFIIDKNAYGMSMMLGIIFGYIINSMKKHWINYALIGFFFVNMLFSYCKTGLIIAALMIIFMFYYDSIKGMNIEKNKKRNKIAIISVSSILLVCFALVGLSLATKGKFLGKIYDILHGSTETGSITTRSYIWDNTYQLLTNGKWLIGRGFGLINKMILPMNQVNEARAMVFPTHSSWVNMIGEGGIFYLAGYIALLVYSIFIIKDDIKKNPTLSIAMLLGVLSFFLYSFIETIHYLTYVFLLPMFILHELPGNGINDCSSKNQ